MYTDMFDSFYYELKFTNRNETENCEIKRCTSRNSDDKILFVGKILNICDLETLCNNYLCLFENESETPDKFYEIREDFDLINKFF